MKLTFVVIVNYRIGPLVVDCLASLQSELPTLGGGRVIVVDNASGDGSAALIRNAIAERGWSGWAELIELPRNGGFAYGNNRAIEHVRNFEPAFGAIVCLNPDTVVCPGAIAELLAHLDGHPRAGIVGPTIENERGDLQLSALSFPSAWSELDSGAQLGPLSRLIGARSMSKMADDSAHSCDWLAGACFVVRREVFDTIGLLDEGYFLYFEETDFCWRAGRGGWACWFVPTARVVHFEGASTGIRDVRRRRPAYWFASRRRLFTKLHGVWGLLLADALWALGRSTLQVRRLFHLGGVREGQSEPQRFASDLLLGDLRAVLSGNLNDLNVVNGRHA
jgi:N-acetylglucosaminyl-diphospho-decaprenol L-rhamnosyltransferase